MAFADGSTATRAVFEMVFFDPILNESKYKSAGCLVEPILWVAWWTPSACFCIGGHELACHAITTAIRTARSTTARQPEYEGNPSLHSITPCSQDLQTSPSLVVSLADRQAVQISSFNGYLPAGIRNKPALAAAMSVMLM